MTGYITGVFIPRRLDKYLRDSTSLSLVEIRAACLSGRVSLVTTGRPLANRAAEDALVFDDDVVVLDGRAIGPRSEHCYLVLNKPRCVTSTASDPGGRADLGPWLRQMPKGVFPVGRLDRDTSGALLFTNDGDFSNAILQPDHHTKKLYWLWLDDDLIDDDPRLQALVGGVTLDDGGDTLRAVSVSVHHRALGYTELHVTLDAGKNRQIRKMCNGVGLRLLQLHRKAIGTLHIDDLPVGEWRVLVSSEVEQLWSSCGGRERIRNTKIAALARLARAAVESGKAHCRLENWLLGNR